MTKNYNDLGVEFKYLIVNDMDQKFGLWVNTVGFQSIQPDSPYPLKDHPSGYFFNAQKGRVLREYQLVYITKGRGLFSSETTPENAGMQRTSNGIVSRSMAYLSPLSPKPDGTNIISVLKVLSLIIW